MAKLIRQQHHRSLHQGLRRAACVLMAVLLGGTIFLSTNAKAREVFFGWVCQKMEAGYHYSHQGKASLPARLVEYQIMVPVGYWLEDSKHTVHSEDYAAEHYVNKAGQYIHFCYVYGTERRKDTQFLVENGPERKSVEIHGNSGDLYLSHDTAHPNRIFWADQETDALLEVVAFLDEEAMVALAESVKPIAK